MYTIPEINVFKTSRPSVYTENAGIDLNLELILVPGGTFFMGGQDDEVQENEKPVHPVTLKSYYMGKYPVTQAQYKKVMGNDKNMSLRKDDNCPVNNVTWDEAQEFCLKLSKLIGNTCHLPTEAEWEYAAQGGQKLHLPKKQHTRFKYAGSNNIDEVAYYSNNQNGGERVVGQKKPNELGLYDMSGNISEWCQDWRDDKYYESSPTQNPCGPQSGSYRVLRGGSWHHSPQYCRVSLRDRDAPSMRHPCYGFRLVFAPQFGG